MKYIAALVLIACSIASCSAPSPMIETVDEAIERVGRGDPVLVEDYDAFVWVYYDEEPAVITLVPRGSEYDILHAKVWIITVSLTGE